MEVHAHTHLPTSRKKKWTHYFWEFLMLFLAVFCGFLAEYQLEHVIEQKREKQFIKALIEDLKLDTTSMDLSSERNRKRIMGLDTLARYIWDKNTITKQDAKRLYDLKFSHTGNFLKVIFSRSTITQLKNSGNLRLIRNMTITDSILKYDLASTMMDGYADHIQNFVTDNYKAEYSIFNDKFWRYNFRSPEEYANADFDLLSYDYKELNGYASRITHQRASMVTYINLFIPAQKRRANELITLLKSEYHLSDDRRTSLEE